MGSRPQARLSCEMNLNPTIILGSQLQQLFPVSYTPLRELMTKPPKQTRVLLGGSKGPICPYSFHCRLLELVTPERYWQGMQGTQWDLTQSSYFCGPLFSGLPVDLSVTSQKEPLTDDRNSSLVLAEEEGKLSEI